MQTDVYCQIWQLIDTKRNKSMSPVLCRSTISSYPPTDLANNLLHDAFRVARVHHHPKSVSKSAALSSVPIFVSFFFPFALLQVLTQLLQISKVVRSTWKACSCRRPNVSLGFFSNLKIAPKCSTIGRRLGKTGNTEGWGMRFAPIFVVCCYSFFSSCVSSLYLYKPTHVPDISF